jgi:hypothetical protein
MLVDHDQEVPMRVHILSMLAVGAVLATVPATAGASAAATSPGSWSTDARVVNRTPASPPEVTGIRVAHHPRFDRVVVDLRGAAPGFAIRYVKRLHADPSGRVVDLRGPASLRIVLNPANGHDPETGVVTLTTPDRTAWRLDQVRETAVIGDFEAVFTVGAGLARRAPFRVLTLTNPTRIVVDVRH